MMELIAGLLVAIATAAYVLEPLTRHAGIGRDDAYRAAVDPEVIVAEMRRRLAASCPACGTAAPPAGAFCMKCGRVLVS